MSLGDKKSTDAPSAVDLTKAAGGFRMTLSGPPMEAGMSALNVFAGGRAPSNAFEWWLSMFPTAPFMGVKWIMSDVIFGAIEATGDPAADAEKQTLSMAGSRLAAPERPTSPARLRVVESAPVESPAAPEPAAPKAAAPKPSAPKAAPKKAQPRHTDLKLIKGVGPRLEEMLKAEGVGSLEQIAGFTKADLEKLDDKLGAFRGRSQRDDWIGQAKALIK